MKFPRVFFLLSFALLTGHNLQAAEPPTRCYDFTIESAVREFKAEPRTEKWCYRQIPGTGTYVFNGDYGEVKPELALVKTEQGTINQGSLAAGTIRYHNVPYREFNPFAVPLEEPRDRVTVPTPTAEGFAESADEVLRNLLAAKPEGHLDDESLLAADASYMPWRGYWWPLKGLTILAPLGKYDSFVSRRSGETASGWEQSYHNSHGIWWEGHCNGWAAAAILRPEPNAVRVDDLSGTSFAVSDQKAIATEADYCAPSAFYGWRKNSGSGVSVADFHKALVHYIGYLHKPIAFNIRSDGPIDNRVISGYSMDIESVGASKLVTVTLKVHEYDYNISDEPGVAKIVSKTYKYKLRSNGRGSWRSKRPGFVWVPLSTGGNCSQGNPKMNQDFVSAILGR